jgi:Tol biopolymer transport system component
VYLFPVAGGEPKSAAGVEAGEFPTAWSSDGRSLFVMTRGQIPAQVFRVDVSTGQRTFWRSFEPADSAGIDTIRGVLVSADNKSYVYGYSRTLSDLYLVQGLK